MCEKKEEIKKQPQKLLPRRLLSLEVVLFLLGTRSQLELGQQGQGSATEGKRDEEEARGQWNEDQKKR